MGGSPKKQPDERRPSFEKGKFRDPTIEPTLDAEYKKSDLLAIVKKAVQVAHKPAKGSA